MDKPDVEKLQREWQAQHGRGPVQDFCFALLLQGGCTDISVVALKKKDDGINWERDGGPTRYAKRVTAPYILVEATLHMNVRVTCPMMPWDEASKDLFFRLLKESGSSTND